MVTNGDRSIVTLRDVAARAGVKPSAVSNWRKRNLGFPAPVGSAGREEHFDAAAVDAWLRQTGRLKEPAQEGARPRLGKTDRDCQARAAMALLTLYTVAAKEDRRLLAGTPARDLLGQAVSLAKKYEQLRLRPGVLTTMLDPDLDAAALDLDGVVADAANNPAGAAALFEEMMARREGAGGGHLAFSQSSPHLARMMSQLVASDCITVFDPACGEGGLLLACAEGQRDRRLVGTEKHVGAYVVASQRLKVHGLTADLRLADALEDDPFEGQRFDAVASEPPFGTRGKSTDELALAFHGGSGASTDMQWVLHCLLKTGHDGVAIIAQPAGALGREGSDAILRGELLRRGHVRALIGLPGGLSPASSAPLVLWVLSPEGYTDRRQDVLFVDLSWLPTRTPLDLTSLTDEVFPDAVADYKHWMRAPDTFDGRAGMSAAVSVLDLLDVSAPLHPHYWVGRADRLRGRHIWTTRQEEATESLHAAITDLETTEPPVDSLALEMGDPPRFVPLSTLAEAGRLELIRGEPVDKSELTAEGAPVLTSASLGDPHEPLKPAGHLPAPLASVTKPGDVIFLPRGRTLRAVIDSDGGRSVAAPLTIVRPTQGDPGMAPRLLAALLSSQRIHSLATGSTLLSVTPKFVTLPRLDARTATAADANLAFLEALERKTLNLLDQIEEARATLVEGLETGAALHPES